MNRKQRRKMAAQYKKSGNPELDAKLKLFSKMSNNCLVCNDKLDKTDIKMLSEWIVIVRDAESKINLYCPDCWSKAMKAVETLEELSENEKNK